MVEEFTVQVTSRHVYTTRRNRGHDAAFALFFLCQVRPQRLDEKISYRGVMLRREEARFAGTGRTAREKGNIAAHSKKGERRVCERLAAAKSTPTSIGIERLNRRFCRGRPLFQIQASEVALCQCKAPSNASSKLLR